MAFDLEKALRGVKDVPNSGTGREQIEYIDIDDIRSDDKNFYSLDGIEELAANIELVGLQQPLRVRSDPNAADKVIISSGHRRAAALRKLVEEGAEVLRQVPCIREAESGESAELQELRLIYANSDTRRMSLADLSKQAERVEELLYKLKEQGVEFPGRMRDHVAEACKVSKSKLSRLKVIRDNLTEPHFLESWNKGELSEAVAYVIAQQSPERQSQIFVLYASTRDMKYVYENSIASFIADADRLEARKCKKCESGKCDNASMILQKLHGPTDYSYKPCKYDSNKCCTACENLATCKTACPLLADKVKKLKENKQLAALQEKRAQEAKDAPYVQLISNLVQRFSLARIGAGLSVNEAMTAMGRSYYGVDEDIIKLENLAEKIIPNTALKMYGWNVMAEEYRTLIKAADAFGCSTDYLLCRTDKKNGEREAKPFKWQTGTPEKPCRAVGRFKLDDKTTLERIVSWDGTRWSLGAGGEIEVECVGWFPLPEA